MLRIAVTLAVVAVALGMPLEETFEKFKADHGKVYKDLEEESYRKQVFSENLDLVIRHNQDFERGDATFEMGINEYSDLTHDEFVKQMNGYLHEKKQAKPMLNMHQNIVMDVPATMDWRTKGYVTGIKNQMQCGSCWAFSATGSLEGQHFKKTGMLISLSEQNLMDCSKPEGNMGCNGGLMDQAFEYIKKNAGVDTEMSYPYEAKDGKCRFNRMNVGANDTGYVDIMTGSEMDLLNACGTIGPISVAIDASKRSFQMYKSGVYKDMECSSTQLDHGVLAVGYGMEDNGDKYWLVKNSWGTSWGMKGYIKMARDMNNMCGIATAASYPTV